MIFLYKNRIPTIINLCVAIILIISNIEAQNLIPNPGFEQFNNLPTETGKWCNSNFWDNLNGYCEYDTIYGSPDYLHQDGTYPASLPVSVFSTTTPFQGNAIMGLYLWNGLDDTTSLREYISTSTFFPIEVGESYTLSFYISNGFTDIRYGGYGISNFGVYLSETKPLQTFANPILVNPQIEISDILYSNDWLQLSFTFTADNPYQYITIGNFKYNSDITVEQFEPYSAKGVAYYYIDEVCLVKEGEDCSISISLPSPLSTESNINIYPNPVSSNTLNVTSTKIDLNNKIVSIYDSLGKLIQSSTVNCKVEACEIPIEYLPKGVYFLKIQTNSGLWAEKFVRQ